MKWGWGVLPNSCFIESAFLLSWWSLPSNDLFSTSILFYRTRTYSSVWENSLLVSWLKELRLSTHRINSFILACWVSSKSCGSLDHRSDSVHNVSFLFLLQGSGRRSAGCSMLSLYSAWSYSSPLTSSSFPSLGPSLNTVPGFLGIRIWNGVRSEIL